jgi:endonuclease YncB( thermonuclease family)
MPTRPAILVRRFIAALAQCAALILLAAAFASAAELHGKVIAVADGDSITVLDADKRQHKVRIAAIDAPERRQAYGTRARQHLAELIFGKDVIVAWDKRDRYGRILGRVLAMECAAQTCAHTLDVGLAQIKAGYAWHYRRYANEQPARERQRYAAAEQAARAQRAGLWRDDDPSPPWEFRRASVSGRPG